MTNYGEKHRNLSINTDASVGGMVTGDLIVSGGEVRVGGSINRLLVSGGTVRVAGSVFGALVVSGGEVDVTGRVQSILVDGGSVKIAVGASVGGRVLDSDGRWIAPGGMWMIDDETTRFDAGEVL